MKGIRIINWLIVILIGGIIFFLSAFFFLGTIDDHQILKEQLIISFVSRFGGIFIVVAMSTMIIYLINQLVHKLRPEIVDEKYPKRIASRSLLIFSLLDLVGTSIFFLR